MNAALDLATSKPHLARGVRLRHDAARNQWVLLAPERVMQADAIAVAVLQLCDGERTLQQITATLADTYKADPQRIKADVVALLSSLAEKRMVVL